MLMNSLSVIDILSKLKTVNEEEIDSSLSQIQKLYEYLDKKANNIVIVYGCKNVLEDVPVISVV